MTHAEQVLGLQPGSFPFESRFCEARGAKVHYVDEGKGQMLFMIHGNPSWSFLFRHLILTLRSKYRCIAIDLPGFGLSVPPQGYRYRPEEHAAVVTQVLEHLDVQDGILLTHDWGDPIGLTAALAAPHRLTRFVMGNTWAWPVNGNLRFEVFARLLGGPIGRFGARRFNLFVNGVMFRSARRHPFSDAVKQAYCAPLATPEQRKGSYIFPAAILKSHLFLAALEKRLPSLDGRRFLFVWPDGDTAFREPELAHWQSIYPEARIVRLNNCGHYVFEEAGEECATALATWLDETSLIP